MLALVVLLGLPVSTPVSPDEVPGPRMLGSQPQCRLLVRGATRLSDKKAAWLAEKSRRPNLHLSDADLRPQRAQPVKRGRKPHLEAHSPRPGERVVPITTLYNVWTREALPVLPGDSLEGRFRFFLRDHYTNQATRMDMRLAEVLIGAAREFSAPRIEIVSGYRSPKYNLMLRKKGRQVARTSQHIEGNAVDFRIRGVAAKKLLRFVRSLRVGGVGFYPNSQFVHCDTGRIRFWKGS